MFILPLLLVGCGTHDLKFDDEDCPPVSWYADIDGDGFGGEATVSACDAPDGFVANADDCDDDDTVVHPGAPESCNGLDDDCNGVIDDGLPLAEGWLDADGDTFGDIATPNTSCTLASGFVEDSQDCDDADPAVHPDAQELCNGYDDDCDGLADDLDSPIFGVPTWGEDLDGDGYGTSEVTLTSCAGADGYAADVTDCDDEDDAIHPGAGEVCFDGLDNDCDGLSSDICAPEYDGATPGEGVYPDPCDPTAIPGDVSLCASGIAALLPSGSTFPTVQDAIDAASPGDVVSVCPGTWSENLTQSVSPLSLAGYGSGVSVVDGGGGRVVEMPDVGNDLTIVDLTIRGGGADEGAGLRGSGATLCIARSTFADNVATENGGAIYLAETGSLTVDNTLFYGNIATSAGGAVELPGRTSAYMIEVTDSLFDANAANQGGAMDIDSTSAATISNTGFRSNMAGHGGALVYSGWGPALTLELDSVTFSDNQATVGGAMSVGSWAFETVTATNCLFERNEASRSGGAISFENWSGGTFTARATEFRENVSVNGGTVYLASYGAEALDFQECTFDSNVAVAGAALYIDALGPTSIVTALLTNSTLTSNIGSGTTCGAAYLWKGSSTAVIALTSVTSDWGSGSTDNLPDDVCSPWWTSGYAYGAAASLDCTSLGCG